MALQKVPFPVQFGVGLDTKTDEKALQAGQLVDLQDGVFINPRSIRTRNGCPDIARAGQQGLGLALYNNELLAGADGFLKTYSPQLQDWTPRGRLRAPVAKTASVIQPTVDCADLDVCSSGGLTCVIWEDGSGNIFAQVTDENTGANLLSVTAPIFTNLNQQLAYPRVLAQNGKFFVFFYYNSQIEVLHLPFDTLQFSNPVVVQANVGSPLFSIRTYESNFILAFLLHVGDVPALSLCFVTQEGMVGTIPTGFPPLTSYSEAAYGPVERCLNLTLHDSGLIYVWYGSEGVYPATGENLSVLITNGNLNALNATQQVVAKGNIVNVSGVPAPFTDRQAESVMAFFEVDPASGPNYNAQVWAAEVSIQAPFTVGSAFIQVVLFTGQGAPQNGVVFRSIGLASEAFLVDGIPMVWAAYDSVPQSKYLLLTIPAFDTEPGYVIGRVLEGDGTGLISKPSSVTQTAAGLYVAALGSRVNYTIAQAGGSSTRTLIQGKKKGVSTASLDFRLEKEHSVQIGQTSLFTGALVSDYDGEEVYENNTNVFPESSPQDFETNTLKVTIASVIQAGSSQMGCYAGTTAWAGNTPYNLGDVATQGGSRYCCIGAGVSSPAGSGAGPANASNPFAPSIVDGSVTWAYVEVASTGTGARMAFDIVFPPDGTGLVPSPSGSQIRTNQYLTVFCDNMDPPGTFAGSVTPQGGPTLNWFVFFVAGDAGGGPGPTTWNAGPQNQGSVISVPLLPTDSQADVARKFVAAWARAQALSATGLFEVILLNDANNTVRIVTATPGSITVPTPPPILPAAGAAGVQPPVPHSLPGFWRSSPGTSSSKNVDHILFPHARWIQPSQWFSLEGVSTSTAHVLCYVWFKVSFDGGATFQGTDPAPPGFLGPGVGIEVDLLSTDLDFAVAFKVATALQAFRYVGHPVFTATNALVGFPQSSIAIVTSAANGVISTYVGTGSTVGGLINTPLQSGLASGGQRAYYFVYRLPDPKGKLHYSAPSIPQVVSVQPGPALPAGFPGPVFPNNGTVLGTAPMYRLTDHAGFLVEVYRTQANSVVPYLISAQANDPTVDTVSFTDALQDSMLPGATVLYAVASWAGSGEVENNCPPACSLMCNWGLRAMLSGLADDGNTIWFSKEWTPGTVREPEFSGLFTIQVDPTGGPITAIQAMDEKLIIFKGSRILYMTGEGPDTSGANSDFSVPLIIATDVGCINPNSVVFTAQGLFFQSAKGIYLLDRGLSVSYIGAPVEKFNTQVITSAKLVADTTQVRFTCESGVSLVYDYFVNQWSTFTNYNALDSIIWQGHYLYETADGRVCMETPGRFVEAGGNLGLRFTTAWLSVSNQIQGFQRVYTALWAGTYFGKHNVVVSTAYNGDPTIRDVRSLDYGVLLGLSPYGLGDTYGSQNPIGSGPYGAPLPYGQSMPFGDTLETLDYEFEVRPAWTQKCKQIRYTVEMVPEDAGGCCSVDDLTLVVGVIGPAWRASLNKRLS